MDAANIWSLASFEKSDILDGRYFFLEESDGQYYHRRSVAIGRWSPGDGGFKDVCIYIMSLTGKEDLILK